MFELPIPSDATSHYLTLPDVRIHYWLLGSGPPVILLHGLGLGGADWFPVAQGLAQHYQLALIDLRGFGSSSLSRRRDYRIASMAADCMQVIAQWGKGPVHVVGLSLGGCVALQMALAAPQLVDSLVLVNTFARMRFGLRTSPWRKIARLWAARNIATLADFVAHEHFHDPALQSLASERLRHNDLHVLHRTMWEIARFNVLPHLRRIHHPTLLLLGARDNTVPRQCTTDLQAGIPHAQVRLIDDAGHALPFDQPEAFVEAVLAF